MLSLINLVKKLKNKYTPWYRRDYKKFVKLSKNINEFIIEDNFPCTKDKYLTSGIQDSGHYFYQDLYVAREIYMAQSQKHVDIGSRIDGFVAHIAVFMKVEVFDIRPQPNHIKNVKFSQVDIMKNVSTYTNYCDSISSLSTVEHFGLGRYGDEIDPDGHLKGFENISKILKSCGTFYFSVPIGPSRIEFNAHRIFNLKYLTYWVQEKFEILKFSYIDDLNEFHENVNLNYEMIKGNCGCKNGCAIFVLRKK